MPWYPTDALACALKLGGEVPAAAVEGRVMGELLMALWSAENPGIQKSVLDLILNLYKSDPLPSQNAVVAICGTWHSRAIWEHTEPHITASMLGDVDMLLALDLMSDLAANNELNVAAA